MSVRRVVPNVFDSDLASTRSFYSEVFELDTVMDLGWISTLAARETPAAQLSVLKPGTDGEPEPFVSIEVDDVDAVYERACTLGHEIAYPLRDEPWGVRRFMLCDPSGRIINVLAHRSG